MDSVDRQLLNIIQTEFPIARRPFKMIAEQMELSEGEVLKRVARLAEEGIIRKMGPVFNAQKLGYSSVLVAAKVPADRLEAAADVVSAFPSVTHNYGREGEYNLWFTLICPSMEEAEFTLGEIRAAAQIDDMHMLPAERVFKIKVDFEL